MTRPPQDTLFLRGLIAGVLSILFCGCTHSSAKAKAFTFKDPAIALDAQRLQDRLKVSPTDTKSRLELGRLYLSEDMPDAAIGEFENIIGHDSANVQVMCLLALAYQRRLPPSLDKAAGVLEKAAQIAPDDADVHLSLGQVDDKLKQENNAIAEFRRTIELSMDPATLVSAHLGLMAIYRRQGDSSNAKAEYDAAYAIYPGVEELIRQAEINRMTPVPTYVGEPAGRSDGLHPTLEERIQRLRKELSSTGGKNR
jgi:Tfp pilus assembly protein PilF